MRIPLSYNLRNLRVRVTATTMTVLGIAVSVGIALFTLALLYSLKKAFATNGEKLNIIAVRKGSDAEFMSSIPRDSAEIVKNLPGVAVDAQSRPLVSGETVAVVVLSRRKGGGETNVTIRGLTPIGLELRPSLHLVEGRWFDAGQQEVVVSRSVEKRFLGTDVGNSLVLGSAKWQVVGVFDSGGSSQESEILVDANQVTTNFHRPMYSSVLARASDEAAAAALMQRITADQRLDLDATPEQQFYAEQTDSGTSIRFVGTMTTIIMAIGSCFAAMNTMYAAVIYRSREIATLRTLGFSRGSVMASFLFESFILANLGFAVAVVAMLPFNGLVNDTLNPYSFSEVVFRLQLSGSVLAEAFLFAVAIGLIGGAIPAWYAARRPIAEGLQS
jgi:putative ABC transport system permease protein